MEVRKGGGTKKYKKVRQSGAILHRGTENLTEDSSVYTYDENNT